MCCGCLSHFEVVMQGKEMVGTIKPDSYMLAFASAILEGFQMLT